MRLFSLWLSEQGRGFRGSQLSLCGECPPDDLNYRGSKIMKAIIYRSDACFEGCRIAALSLVLGLVLSAAALAQQPANVPCGLIGWWPLDGNAIDIRGGNNGAIQGGAFSPAMVQQGWRSGGQGSVIVVPNS